MAAKDRLFAQFTLMNFLQGSRDRSVKEILDHLHQNTYWGRAQLARRGPDDLGLRNVQNWLAEIRESPEFGRYVTYREDPENRRQYLYSSTAPTVGQRAMPVEEACLVLMAEKFLQAAIPADFVDAALQDLFVAARARLKEHDRLPKPYRRQVREYLKRIAIEQRGQALVERRIPYEVLGPLSRAILEGKRIDCRYRGRPCELHPYGIVLRSPKIYLLAAEDRLFRSKRSEPVAPAQYLCARLSDVAVSERQNFVPDDFDAEAFIATTGLDLAASDLTDLPSRGFTLVLRLFEAGRDNLLQDLEDFPLSNEQEIVREQDTGNYVLTARRMRATHQLVEWIVGRLDRVEVLEPSSIRRHIVDRLDAMRAIYT